MRGRMLPGSNISAAKRWGWASVMDAVEQGLGACPWEPVPWQDLARRRAAPSPSGHRAIHQTTTPAELGHGETALFQFGEQSIVSVGGDVRSHALRCLTEIAAQRETDGGPSKVYVSPSSTQVRRTLYSPASAAVKLPEIDVLVPGNSCPDDQRCATILVRSLRTLKYRS